MFHNLSGYDAHLFVRELGKKFDSGFNSIIAKNKEKYISFNVNVAIDEYETFSGGVKWVMRQLQFINSIRFMASSLDLLSKNLVGTNGMVCEECRNKVELMHIDENYVNHGTCGECMWRCESSQVKD